MNIFDAMSLGQLIFFIIQLRSYSKISLKYLKRSSTRGFIKIFANCSSVQTNCKSNDTLLNMISNKMIFNFNVLKKKNILVL